MVDKSPLLIIVRILIIPRLSIRQDREGSMIDQDGLGSIEDDVFIVNSWQKIMMRSRGTFTPTRRRYSSRANNRNKEETSFIIEKKVKTLENSKYFSSKRIICSSFYPPFLEMHFYWNLPSFQLLYFYTSIFPSRKIVIVGKNKCFIAWSTIRRRET